MRKTTSAAMASANRIGWTIAPPAIAMTSRMMPMISHNMPSSFGWLGRHVNVILPQSFRRLLPPLVGLCVGVIQNSTLASIIGVPEVLEAAQRQTNALAVPTVDPATLEISGDDSHAFEIYMGVFILFFLISFPLTRLTAYLERRLV